MPAGAWAEDRPAAPTSLDWPFRTADARVRLKFCPIVEAGRSTGTASRWVLGRHKLGNGSASGLRWQGHSPVQGNPSVADYDPDYLRAGAVFAGAS